MEIKLKVRPVNEDQLIYEVESASGGWHNVDLSKYNGNGTCSCKSFEMRKHKNIHTGNPLYSDTTRCKHLIRATEFFANRELDKKSKEINK